MAQEQAYSPFIASIKVQLKELNSPDDLVALGVFGSTKTAANLRSKGEGPSFVKIKGAGIRYPRNSVVDWLKRTTVIVNQPELQRG